MLLTFCGNQELRGVYHFILTLHPSKATFNNTEPSEHFTSNCITWQKSARKRSSISAVPVAQLETSSKKFPE